MRSAVGIMARPTIFLLCAAIVISISIGALYTHSAFGINYGAGSYGTCTFDNCSITLTTSGAVSANVTPVAGATRCTVSSDTVTATTDSSTGYTVTLTDSDTTNTLTGPSSIAASTGTAAAPVTLAANTWGYRVDSIGGFGAGPTSTLTSGVTPSQTFAAVPLSTGTAATIRTTSTTDTGTVSTPVWYGVCANSSLKSGAYTDSVTYTAVIN